MVKVITYGTYDLLHYGHIRLLERAKALGDYLIVGVTADDFDKQRGKINVRQSLMERIEAVRATGFADEVIVEEYEGQKIDDIRKYDVDIFTVGSDWVGKFDYLNEYCQVIYLPRTEGVSSSELRESDSPVRLGLVGDARFVSKLWREVPFVNGLRVAALCTRSGALSAQGRREGLTLVTEDYDGLLDAVDAVYLRSRPEEHAFQIRRALERGKHVLCESPLTLSRREGEELMALAKEKKLILMEAIKTAYATAYARLLLLVKGGRIGEVLSVDAACTSLRGPDDAAEWNGIHEWGPTALLPVFQMLGTDYRDCRIASRFRDGGHDSFTKLDFVYEHAVASVKVGDGVKTEGELIVSGTGGYLYVPAPWWKTDYFELRCEDPADNKRWFYQLDGEGIRYELVAFTRAIERGRLISDIGENVTLAIASVMESFDAKRNMVLL
ncbi:MAG: adenylyltransferase/cytidyltransferase family protein [Oscillospiraceae bacterium]|nr:adenylyltransferase/cytidyltransferase family protein [Oscillospiraceae bacterium]